MRKFVVCLFAAASLLSALSAEADIFGRIQGIVHDPQHRPVVGVDVTLKSATSAWSQTTQTEAGRLLFVFGGAGRRLRGDR